MATSRKITGLVLGAGSSSRLGQPKQLLTYRGKPLLQTTVDNAIAARFDQVIVAVGGAAPEVRDAVDFGSADVAENVAFTTGCSSSIVAALGRVDPASDGLVLLLGDQPALPWRPSTPVSINWLHQPTPPAVRRYWSVRMRTVEVTRSGLPARCLAPSPRYRVTKRCGSCWNPVATQVDELPRPGPVPPDVDTWEDYEALLKADE